jgi:hypothetical protein
MKLLTFLISGFLLITTLVACKKSTEQTTTPTPTPTPPPVTVPQGNYSGQYLTLSTVENIASPWTELKADTVYTGYNLLSAKVKAIPTGLEDKIISFYLPKDYMVVFTENLDGTGESATFVAKDSAIKANLPTRLRNNISYIRYIKINNPEKKGTGSTNAAAVQNFTAQWYYGWSIDKASFTNQQFVPMTWGKGTCTDPQAKYLIERNDVDHLLSFNEPDNADQSNVPVDTAIARYKIMMKTGLRLGSPVTTQDQAFGTGKWLTNFISKAVTQKLRVDYIAVHWYDWGNQNNNAATDSLTAERVFTRFTNYINNVRLAYPNMPIWLTEYNANINRTSETVHKYFMKLSTEWMNSQSFIERYAYFFPNTLPAVNPDNSLTSAAAYWKSLPTTKSLSGNIIGDAILVK